MISEGRHYRPPQQTPNITNISVVLPAEPAVTLNCTVEKGESPSAGCYDCRSSVFVDKFFRRLGLAVGLVVAIFLIRSLVKALYMWKWPDAPEPMDMIFPVWEGPVFVAQLLGMAEIFGGMMLSGCWLWMVAGCCGIIFGPVLFVIIVAIRVGELAGHHHEGSHLGACLPYGSAKWELGLKL